MMTWNDIKIHILDGYEIEDILNVLELDAENLLDTYKDKVYDNLDQFRLDNDLEGYIDDD